jgi:hypothetical protein
MENIPHRLIWKLEVFDDSGNVIASLFRQSNQPLSISGPGISGNPLALSEALRDLAQCSRFFPFHDHPKLPTPPLDPSAN